MTTAALACPKCSYVRKGSDHAPAWQCPSCGIAYAKFQTGTEGKAGAVERDVRECRAIPAGRGDQAGGVAILVYGLLAVLLGVSFFTFHKLGFDALRVTLALFAASAFVFWMRALRRKRLVEDVPTSTAASASQGYVELAGTAQPARGHVLKARLTGNPCIWYFYTVDGPNRKGEYVRIDEGTAVVPFILRDRTGDCYVESEQAEIVCDRCQTWVGDNGHRYCEWSIRVGDEVHAVGHLETGDASASRHFHLAAAYELGDEQKSDPAAYRERHDTNRDGRVDTKEFAAALARKREGLVPDQTNQGGTHSLGPSSDGRPFLVVCGREDRARSHYSRLTAVHIAVFVGSLGALAFLL
jgi:hypothetical protein